MTFERVFDLNAALARKSCFLFGPRMCGKSWLVRSSLRAVTIIDLLRSDVSLPLSRRPSALEEMCAGKAVVAIDEIQKIPQLLDEVHRLIELKGTRFLLTGSSARKLRTAGVNLLGGRASVRRLNPLSAVEIGAAFDLNKALENGLLPSMYLSDDPDTDLNDYVGTYLRQEIMQESLVRNLPAFSSFLAFAAMVNGEQINYQKLASDAGLPRSTVQEYFGILVDTLVGSELPAWRGKTTRRSFTSPKFYFFDTGVARTLQRRSSLNEMTPEFGKAFEHYIFHELKTYKDLRGDREGLAYWRDYTGCEVDFILNDATAIEVKASTNVNRGDLRGLFALQREKVCRNHLVVSRDPVERRIGDVQVIPYADFVRRLHAGEWD